MSRDGGSITRSTQHRIWDRVHEQKNSASVVGNIFFRFTDDVRKAASREVGTTNGYCPGLVVEVAVGVGGMTWGQADREAAGGK